MKIRLWKLATIVLAACVVGCGSSGAPGRSGALASVFNKGDFNQPSYDQLSFQFPGTPDGGVPLYNTPLIQEFSPYLLPTGETIIFGKGFMPSSSYVTPIWRVTAQGTLSPDEENLNSLLHTNCDTTTLNQSAQDPDGRVYGLFWCKSKDVYSTFFFRLNVNGQLDPAFAPIDVSADFKFKTFSQIRYRAGQGYFFAGADAWGGYYAGDRSQVALFQIRETETGFALKQLRELKSLAPGMYAMPQIWINRQGNLLIAAPFHSTDKVRLITLDPTFAQVLARSEYVYDSGLTPGASASFMSEDSAGKLFVQISAWFHHYLVRLVSSDGAHYALDKTFGPLDSPERALVNHVPVPSRTIFENHRLFVGPDNRPMLLNVFIKAKADRSATVNTTLNLLSETGVFGTDVPMDHFELPTYSLEGYDRGYYDIDGSMLFLPKSKDAIVWTKAMRYRDRHQDPATDRIDTLNFYRVSRSTLPLD